MSKLKTVMRLRRLLISFRDASRGLRAVLRSEQNFRIQVFIGVIALFLAAVLPLKAWEVVLLILLIMFVLVMELLNTAFEYVSDLIKPRLNHYVYMLKDIMAAAVLLTSLGALIIGLIIFIPHFINLAR